MEDTDGSRLLNLCCVPRNITDALKLKTWDSCILRSSFRQDDASAVLSISVVLTITAINEASTYDNPIFIHPLLLQVLVTAQIEALNANKYLSSVDGSNDDLRLDVSLAPFPCLSCYDDGTNQYGNEEGRPEDGDAAGMMTWQLFPLKPRRGNRFPTLPSDSTIIIKVIHSDEPNITEEDIKLGLQDEFMVVMRGIFLVISLDAGYECMEGSTCFVGSVEEIVLSSASSSAPQSQSREHLVETEKETAYKIYPADDTSFNIQLRFQLDGSRKAQRTQQSQVSKFYWNGDILSDTPGYDEMLDDLSSFVISEPSASTTARPTGLLLTGSSGVGKTRLAMSLASRVVKHFGETNGNHSPVHWVLVPDLIQEAAIVLSDEQLLKKLLPPWTNLEMNSVCHLVVIDELDALLSDGDAGEDEDDAYRDSEWILVRNAILLAVDHLAAKGIFVIGICVAETGSVVRELVKVGRLEKVVRIPAPTQAQREIILESFLGGYPSNWPSIIAGVTAGCVASDLRRICSDAATESSSTDWSLTLKDLREAAQRCVPSELSEFDVTKAVICPLEGRISNAQHFDWAWENFGGYTTEKKRIFRTIVHPWRKLLAEEKIDFGVSPPKGVLFHGPSGVGKTLAATCLAASLELCVVKVRASDVMDKWLGGSEAIIRSLFSRARSAAPCLLFFDEVDAIGTNREHDDLGADVTSRILSTLLNEMDGVSSSENGDRVLVVACTNRLEDLDAALLRPGRLEVQIELSVPSSDDRLLIFKRFLENVPFSDDIDLPEVVTRLHGSTTGADIEGIVRDAFSAAIRSASSLAVDEGEIALKEEHLVEAVAMRGLEETDVFDDY